MQEKIKNKLSFYCCVCVENKKLEPIKNGKESRRKFYDIKLNDDIVDPKYKFYQKHLICNRCLVNFSKEKLRLNERINQKLTKDIEVNSFCKICNTDHDIILPKNSKKTNGCTNGCIIF